jgi:hypothetical protein
LSSLRQAVWAHFLQVGGGAIQPNPSSFASLHKMSAIYDVCYMLFVCVIAPGTIIIAIMRYRRRRKAKVKLRNGGLYWVRLGRMVVDQTATWDSRTHVAIMLIKHVVEYPEDLRLLASNVPRMIIQSGRSKRFDPFDFLTDVASRPLLRPRIRSKAMSALRRYKRPQRIGFWRALSERLFKHRRRLPASTSA